MRLWCALILLLIVNVVFVQPSSVNVGESFDRSPRVKRQFGFGWGLPFGMGMGGCCCCGGFGGGFGGLGGWFGR